MPVRRAGNNEAVALPKVRYLFRLEHLVNGFVTDAEAFSDLRNVIVVCCSLSPAMVGSDLFYAGSDAAAVRRIQAFIP
jgi:hypothetical protein